MGWDSASNWNKKSDVVADSLRGLARNGYTVLDHASTSQGLYAAVSKDDKIELVCIMIERKGKEFYRKDLTERMGPAMSDCPLRLLDLVPCPGGYAVDFRKGVELFHAEKSAPVPDLLGKRIECYGVIYKVTAKIKQSFEVYRERDGARFKMSPKQAKAARILPAADLSLENNLK